MLPVLNTVTDLTSSSSSHAINWLADATAPVLLQAAHAKLVRRENQRRLRTRAALLVRQTEAQQRRDEAAAARQDNLEQRAQVDGAAGTSRVG